MASAYWNYFISLERDFVRTLDFVALDPANADTFSDNYAKLLLAVGSEVDVIAKAICKTVSPNKQAENILHYQSTLVAAFIGFHTAEISVVRTGAQLLPWQSWDPKGANGSPNWWRAYNAVKHDRVANFSKGSQRHTLDALAGLLVLNLYFHKSTPEPYPVLLDGGTPQHVVFSGDFKLPGL